MNNAGIGVNIATEGIKQRRNLKSVQFICTKSKRTTGSSLKRGTSYKKPPLESPEPSSKIADMREERELQRLKTLHPNEFTQLYEEAPETFTMRATGNDALLQLKAKYGIVK
jgi:hypothetical protein